MTYRDDPTADLDRILALAAAAGLTIEEFLQAAPPAPPRRKEQRRPESSLYQRIGYAGGLLWLVNTLYRRVLADPLLMSYFKHLDDQDRQWLRWHMLTLLAVVTEDVPPAVGFRWGLHDGSYDQAPTAAGRSSTPGSAAVARSSARASWGNSR
jgi:hypothetical protein